MRERKSAGKQNIFSRRLLPAILSCVFTASFSVNAATVPEYKKNVQTALELTEKLKDAVENDEGLNDIESDEEKRIVAEIRRAVPVSENIEWQGASIETGNQWLEAELTVYDGEKDSSKRAEILTAIAERLGALEEKLAELETSGISGRTKDEDKQKLAEILRREEYQKPEEKQESIVQKWWRELLEWFTGAIPQPVISDDAEKGARSVSFVLQILLYALVTGVIVFFIYRFAPLFLRKRGEKEKSEKKDRIILGERIAAGESAEHLFGEAERLAQSGDLRGAIRQGYIALLCDLSDRRIINLAQHKTNRDYLRDARSNRTIYENVSGLTGSFERHWYGLQTTAEDDWREFRERYRKTVG